MNYKHPTAEYCALVKNAFDWRTIDKFGHIHSKLDPFLVLAAADAPQEVVAAFEQARKAGCEIRFEAHSCNIGGAEYVSLIAPVPPSIRALFDAIDAAKIEDKSMIGIRPTRWFDGSNQLDGHERWQWTTEDG